MIHFSHQKFIPFLKMGHDGRVILFMLGKLSIYSSYLLFTGIPASAHNAGLSESMEVKEKNSSASEWPSTYSLQQKADDGLYRLTGITFKFSFFPNAQYLLSKILLFSVSTCIGSDTP